MDVNSSLMVQFPVKGSLIDSKKGSFGNRTECAAQQAYNSAKGTIATGAVIGTSAASLAAINKYTSGKSYKWNTSINNGLKKVLNDVAEFVKTRVKYGSDALKADGARIIVDKTHPDFKSLSKIKQIWVKGMEKIEHSLAGGIEKLAKTSGRQKLLMGAGALAGAVLLHTIQKYAFQSGQIDQKYNDRAKAQKLAV